ncbi:hypothetical protein N7513_003230 [Penicillium frequentans]|uniref:Uncharacterized protein n=1 Tax=Penicillium frequentans TaxID=3151616 RepID=A0AAD6G8W1_9EURO|nr:hypothetical protein N7494_013227 [Penicillium glabrum]KAJ5557644.1 hypothetical protein N7513_003230 [Penicillium glabrum]
MVKKKLGNSDIATFTGGHGQWPSGEKVSCIGQRHFEEGLYNSVVVNRFQKSCSLVTAEGSDMYIGTHSQHSSDAGLIPLA